MFLNYIAISVIFVLFLIKSMTMVECKPNGQSGNKIKKVEDIKKILGLTSFPNELVSKITHTVLTPSKLKWILDHDLTLKNIMRKKQSKHK